MTKNPGTPEDTLYLDMGDQEPNMIYEMTIDEAMAIVNILSSALWISLAMGRHNYYEQTGQKAKLGIKDIETAVKEDHQKERYSIDYK